MNEDRESKAPALESFLAQYWKDRDAGRVRSLDEYFALFPEDLEGVAREYLFLEEGEAPKATRNTRADTANDDCIGPYRILDELGRGGQGVVYRAEDTRLHRPVALKILTNLRPGSDEVLRRFHREAEVASKLEHPGICGVHDAGTDQGVPYIAMRYVEGETLALKIAEARLGHRSHGELPVVHLPGSDPGEPTEGSAVTSSLPRTEVQRVIRTFEDIAIALHVAHEAGIVHRDIKPGNIMITPAGDPIILDFGLAREEDDLAGLTKTGELFGTPAYMSPEQLMAHRVAIDRRADIWSLGITLYEALTLRRPFEAPTREALYQAVLAKEPPDPRTYNPAVPNDLRVVLETALDKDRDRRYQSALALSEDLRRVRRYEPISARPASSWLRLKRWAQRQPHLAASLGATFLTLVAGLVTAWVLMAEARHERDQKESALKEAKRQEALANAHAASAEAHLREYERLADSKRLQELLEEGAAHEWPARQEHVPAMNAWLARAQGLLSNLEPHRASLAKLLGRDLDQAPDRWRREKLQELVTALEDLASDRAFGNTEAAIRRRRDRALLLETTTVTERKRLWDAATKDVARSRKYVGLELLKAQPGLVPLGPDPQSGLWEFAHPESGAVPERDPNTGHLRFSEESSLVMILIPGGSFTMGAQARRSTLPHHDDLAEPQEGPPHDVVLAPFFISKYEMTQGQWLRCAGDNPSARRPGTPDEFGRDYTLAHPVEQVTWRECGRRLRHVGLLLPTEAQWEYTCRAGRDSRFWTGQDLASLAGAANVADLSALRAQRNWPDAFLTPPAFDDGYVWHAPVGTYRANPFGLHDVHGNVFEWCADSWVANTYARFPVRSLDGLREVPDGKVRIMRGGSFQYSARDARSSSRQAWSPDLANQYLGVRPAMTYVP